ncbi:MAG: hypothetical protein K8U57_20495 [Planctomycetes bacterium]|nr:hypothetical protein [Planctomycetota bacterium]
MARKNTAGTKQLGAELDSALVDEFKAFCSDRGDTVRKHLEMAIRRHLSNPPPKPADVPPLPPVAIPAPPTATDLIRVDKAQESEETKLGKLDARAELANDEAERKENGGKPKKPTPKGKPKK